MDRRNFFRKSLGLGVALAASKTLGAPEHINTYLSSLNQTGYDLAAVKGGEPAAMFDMAIEAFGGMKRFVKKGQSVVVKPNIGWDVTPERAANTNPQLVKRVIESCYDAGAKKVYVFDHTCDNWQRCYSNSGIERAVKEAGGEMAPGNSEKYYQKVDVKNGVRLKSAETHELILESDVFINMPVLKDHGSAEITVSMKNLMGIVWDRGYWHRNDLHQCIADYATFRKPDLNIVDAYNVMKKNGPRGVSKADVVNMKSLIISPDIVAADAAAARIYGLDPASVDYIRIANEMKVGEINLDKLNIKRIKA